jgi:hypothetical protein
LIALRARRQAVQIAREMMHPSIPPPRVLLTPPPLAKLHGPVVFRYVEPPQTIAVKSRPYRHWTWWFVGDHDPILQLTAAAVVIIIAALSMYLNWARH